MAHGPGCPGPGVMLGLRLYRGVLRGQNPPKLGERVLLRRLRLLIPADGGGAAAAAVPWLLPPEWTRRLLTALDDAPRSRPGLAVCAGTGIEVVRIGGGTRLAAAGDDDEKNGDNDRRKVVDSAGMAMPGAVG